MLKIFDQYNNPVGYIDNYTDLCIESELESGDKTMSFTYRDMKSTLIQNEYYIETEDDRYVVKEIDVSSDGYPEICCQLDLEDLEREVISGITAEEATLEGAAQFAIAGTGWRVDTDIDKVRYVAAINVTPLDLLYKIRDGWMCEIRFDTKNRIVYFREEFGEDRGVYFNKALNLKKVQLKNDSYDYYTRILPIGADDLRIGDVNDGVDYLENYQYSDKIKVYLWEDTNYTDAEALKEDAEKKLDDMSKPAKSYDADVIDLAKQSADYDILDYGLGDTIILFDEETGIKDRQRIVKITEYPRDPSKNSCELSNTFLTFEEMQSKLEAAANAFEEITNEDGTVNGYYVHGVTSDGVVVIETVIGEDGSTTTTSTTLTNAMNSYGDEITAISGRLGSLELNSLTVEEANILYASIEDLDATNAYIWNLEARYGDFESLIAEELTAVTASITDLYANYGSIYTLFVEDLTAMTATIEDLAAKYAEIELLIADYAEIVELVAVDLTAEVANINTILSGQVGTGELQSIHLTTDNAVIDDAVILEALIGTVLADIIYSNTIYTDYITITSTDGGVVIAGTTMQFSDSDGNVRLQLGQDATGNFTFVLYDETGEGILIDSTGIYASAIPDGLIVNDMVAADAAIEGSKLDIASVAECLNADGSLTLDAAQVTIDGETLDYKLTTMTEWIEGISLEGLDSITPYFCLWYSAETAPPDTDDLMPAICGEAICGQTICGVTDVSEFWTTEEPYAGKGQYKWIKWYCVYNDGHVEWSVPYCLSDGYIRNETSVIQTQLEVVQGQISEKVWMTDIAESLSTTVTDIWAELNIWLDGIEMEVGNMSTSVSTIEGELTGALVNITTLTEQIATLTITTEGITGVVEDLQGQIAELDGVKDFHAYFCLWYSATIEPPATDDLTPAICGEAICGQTICGVTDVESYWTEEEPVAEKGQYLWIKYLVEYDDGSTGWIGPFCLTDQYTRTQLETMYSDIQGTYSRIEQLSDSITLQVAELNTEIGDTRATFLSEIKELSNSISLTVQGIYDDLEGNYASKASLVLEIDDQNRGVLSGNANLIYLEAGQIVITSGGGKGSFELTEDGNVIINAANFQLDENGNLTATNAYLEGEIHANGGTIGNWYIGTSSLYNGTTSMTSTSNGIYMGADGYRQYNSGDYLNITDTKVENGSSSGDYARLNDSKLEFAQEGVLVGSYTTSYWASVSGTKGIAIETEPDCDYIAFGHRYSSSDTLYSSYYYMSYNDDISPFQHNFFGTVCCRSRVYFDDNYYINNFNINGTDSGICTNGRIWTSANSINGSYCVTDTSGAIAYGMYMTNSNNIRFGNTSYNTILYGSSVYLNGTSTAVTSDRSLKSDIQPLNKNYDSLIDCLTPRAYTVDAQPDQKHIGFVVDEVEEAMKSAGMDPDDYGLTDSFTDDDGKELGAIRYEEIIPILVYEIQQLKSQLKGES